MNSNASLHIDEIYDIGQKVDGLQDLYSIEKKISSEVLQAIHFLEVYFNKPPIYGDDFDYKTVYFYTKANYLTVLLEIACVHYKQLQGEVGSLKGYTSYEEMYFELMLNRLSLMRSSISSYSQNSATQISKQWIAQVHTNLSNLYLETGRILESLEELESVKFEIGMAMGNYGGKLYQLANCSLDKSEQKELLIDALSHFDLVVLHGKDDPYMPSKSYDDFCAAESHIQRLLEHSDYREVSVYSDMPDGYFKDIGLEDNPYRKWCRDNNLALSFRNIVEKHSNTDDIHLPNLGIAYFSKAGTLSYYSWFNTIKQEFNMARYILFQTEYENRDADEVHLSQQNILLINTLDYPAIGYRTEMLKLALKTAYGVLDKIGLICSDFVKSEHSKISRISFTSWFSGLEKGIALYSEFSSLYWLARDLDFKNGSFKTFRRLRNVVEHRFLRVLDNVKTPIEIELDDENKIEYEISYQELNEQTRKVISLVRKAIFYLVFAFNDCYKASMNDEKNIDKLFIPLSLSIYDDEWKN